MSLLAASIFRLTARPPRPHDHCAGRTAATLVCALVASAALQPLRRTAASLDCAQRRVGGGASRAAAALSAAALDRLLSPQIAVAPDEEALVRLGSEIASEILPEALVVVAGTFAAEGDVAEALEAVSVLGDSEALCERVKARCCASFFCSSVRGDEW